MPIPMVDLATQYRNLKPTLEPALLAALEATQFILGPNVQAFEAEAAAYLGVPHAISCANGTDALHLALRALGLGAGDEVITSAFTFIATAEAVAYVGAKAMFVDIDARSFNLDPEQVKRAIGPRTKAILPVHLFGQPADIAALQQLAQQHGLHLIEDCAQSFGSCVQGRKTGAWGDIATFSFFPSKNLGCYGDGGMVTTGSDALAERVRMLRNHGSQVRYYHDIVGYNSRLDELQAVVLRAKLPHLDHYNQQRRRVAQRYGSSLAGLGLELPHEDGIGLHVYHQYTLLCPNTELRSRIQQALAAEKIASAIYYPVPLHQQRVFAADCAGLHLPHTEAVAQRCLSLPIYPELSDAAVDEVVAVIRQALA